MSQTIRPLSVERLNWLLERKMVLEPLVNTLKVYAYSSAAGVANGNFHDALQAASTESILIDAEISILQKHFADMEKQKLAQIQSNSSSSLMKTAAADKPIPITHASMIMGPNS